MRRAIWFLAGFTIFVGLVRLASAACPHYTATTESVSYGVVHTSKACVLDLRITRGEVRVRVKGDGVMRSGFDR